MKTDDNRSSSSMIVMLNCMSDKIFNFYTKTFEINIIDC